MTNVTPQKIQHVRGDLPQVTRRHFRVLQELADNSRLRYLLICYGIEDRGCVDDRYSLFGSASCRGIVGRLLLKIAMHLLGGSESVAQLVPVVALEPEPKPTVH